MKMAAWQVRVVIRVRQDPTGDATGDVSGLGTIKAIKDGSINHWLA